MLQLALAHPGAALMLKDMLQQRPLLRLPKVCLAQLAFHMPSLHLKAGLGAFNAESFVTIIVRCKTHGYMTLNHANEAQSSQQSCSRPAAYRLCGSDMLLHAQGRSMEDTLALAFGDLAPRMQAAESQHGVVRITLHACMPPHGAASKRCQYMCGSRFIKFLRLCVSINFLKS